VEIDPSIKIRVLPGVYPPSDDSYLLIESIDLDNHRKALDMGCGTGIIALHLAKQGLDVTAVDISERAIENTLINSKMNRIKLQIIRSDLFENVNDKYDLITFNPPYLPTSNEDPSWDGGDRGIEIIDRFFADAYRYLEKEGEIYIIASSLTDMKLVEEKYSDTYKFDVIGKKHIFFEDIISYRILIR